MTQANLVSTLEQSPARGDTAAPGSARRPRRLVKHDRRSLTSLVTVGASDRHDSVERARSPYEYKERLPWPRASGPSSPTTAAVRVFTGSGCGCAPAPAARSLPTGVARAVARSLRDPAPAQAGSSAVLPARNRMRRSAEFSVTVSRGVRAAQPDVVVHALRLESNAGNAGDDGDDGDANGPRIGLIVSKAVGNAVERHRVSRRLRHVAKTFVSGLDPADLIVIRARPSSRDATSSRLERQLGQALERVSSKRRASP